MPTVRRGGNSGISESPGKEQVRVDARNSPEVRSSSVGWGDTRPEGALACSFLARRDRVCARSERDENGRQKAREPPAKAREGSERERSERGERPEPERGGGRGDGGVLAAPTEGGAGTTGGTVRFAVEAEVCGAVGCRERSGLLEVERNGRKRVLCAGCAAGWSP